MTESYLLLDHIEVVNASQYLTMTKLKFICFSNIRHSRYYYYCIIF